MNNNGWSKNTTYLAVGMMAGGFLLIVLGWNGAASKDFVQGQFPYLISGGLAGVCLVVGGVALTIIQELRRSTATLAQRLDHIATQLEAAPADTDAATENLPAQRISRDDATREQPALT